MGLLAAARYGLHSARICSSNIRSISTQAVESEFLDKSKQRIFLCFNEWSTDYPEEQRKTGNWITERKVVRSFTIHDDDHKYTTCQPEELTLVASKLIGETRKLQLWTRIGDKILFNDNFHGQRIFWLDTSQLHPKFENSLQRKKKIKSFPVDKCNIAWGEIGGKLYCIDDEYEKDFINRFQVLDTENKSKWQSLDLPPYLLGHYRRREVPHRALFLDGSKKILGWDCHLHTTFCYDVTKPRSKLFSYDFTDPEFGWKPLSYDLTRHGGRPFVIHHQNHPLLGDFNLLLDYYPFAENRLQISPFYMSNDCQSFKAIENSIITLPELCYDYLPSHPPRADDPNNCGLNLMYGKHSFPLFEFVNLGDEKFGFILHKHRYYDPSYWLDNKKHKGEPGGLLFLTYKYNIVVVNKAVEICTTLIGCRHFRYRSHVPSSDGIFMLGAFLI
jgi:hypothetical protein